MDILFIHANTPWGVFGGFVPHYGAAQLVGVLRNQGLSSNIYCDDINLSLKEHAEKICTTEPKCIGISCYDNQFPIVAELARLIKENNRNIRIILGGPTPTNSHKTIIDNYQFIDYCVRGEGERTIVELIPSNWKYESLCKIKGLTFRDKGKTIINEDREPLSEREMNSIPSPYLDDLIELSESGRLGVISSRGCIYQCTFCNFSTLTNRIVRYYEIGRVVSEIVAIDKYYTEKGESPIIQIMDEAFTINRKRTFAILDKLRKIGISLPLSCMSRADLVDSKLLRALANSGFVNINYGLESANNEVLLRVRKARVPRDNTPGYEPEIKFKESFKDAVALAKEYNINANVSIIAGLPGETEESLNETLKFIKELEVDYMHNTLQCFEGTKLYNDAADRGINVLPNKYWHIPYATCTQFDTSTVSPLKGRATNLLQYKKENIKSLYMLFSLMKLDYDYVCISGEDHNLDLDNIPIKSTIIIRNALNMEYSTYLRLRGFRVICLSKENQSNPNSIKYKKDEVSEMHGDYSGFSIIFFPMSELFTIVSKIILMRRRDTKEEMIVAYIDDKWIRMIKESGFDPIQMRFEDSLLINNVILFGKFSFEYSPKAAQRYALNIARFFGFKDNLADYSKQEIRRMAFVHSRTQGYSHAANIT